MAREQEHALTAIETDPQPAIPSTATAPIAPELPAHTLYVMAAACGASAANIYYCQPLLGDFARQFGGTAQQAGMVATAAQVGYGLGLLLFVPLGDIVERRRVVLTLVAICAVLLLATAAAPTLALLIVAQLLVGITATSSQLLIPLGIDLTPPERRGHTVGVLMAGLLCGLLLARVVAGFVADHFGGWRTVFLLAAGVMIVLGLVLRAELPHRAPTLKMTYGKLMRSLLGLSLHTRNLWPATLVSGLSFGSFIGFWTVLSFLMSDYFGRGASEAGLFGIIGLAGAAAAPLAGRVSDRRGPGFTLLLALLLSMAAFALMWGWVAIASLVIGVLLMDLGVQSIQVAAQAKVIALVPEARSRINTIYMVVRFIGGAAGSAIAASAWTYAKWPGVCAAAMTGLALATAIHFIGTRRERMAINQPVPVAP
ncbi:MAG TPA: MFS transporter [Tepidisphaeraceae bacterium]|jgi:predicted MFS family arabinose efflux permease|nr:MFS transporter [Tepidisphaeraceae bacterium]